MTTEDPAQLVKPLEQLCQQLENNLALSEGVPMPLAEKGLYMCSVTSME